MAIDDGVVEPCPVTPFAEITGGRWKLEILYTLDQQGKARFNELLRRLGSLTATTLTRQLRELERDGLVTRTQYNEIPVRVEYETTELLATLVPILESMVEWSDAHHDEVRRARDSYAAQNLA